MPASWNQIVPWLRQIASMVRTHCGVRDVLAVPRQQVVDLVSGGDADVKGIDRRLLREGTPPNQFAGESSRLIADCERRNSVNDPQPSSACGPVAFSGLIANDL